MCTCTLIFSLINDLVVGFFCLGRDKGEFNQSFKHQNTWNEPIWSFWHSSTHAHTFITLIVNLISIYMVGAFFSLWMGHPIRWITSKSWFLFASAQWNKMPSDLTRKTILAIICIKKLEARKSPGFFLFLSFSGAKGPCRIKVICSTKDYVGYCQFCAIKCRLYTIHIWNIHFDITSCSPNLLPLQLEHTLYAISISILCGCQKHIIQFFFSAI